MTNKDYYDVLGIAHDATSTEIKAAYRRMAMRYHPDRGGSHEKMLLINEAFQILINPDSRSEYDRLAADPTWTKASERMNRARANANNYPRSWADFDALFDRVCADFAKAEWDSSGSGFYKFPTVKNSTSGCLFILIGALLGLLIAAINIRILKGPAAFLPIAFGAWLGKMAHQVLSKFLKPSTVHSEKGVLHISCPKCSARLKVSRVGNSRVRCPMCTHVFRSNA
jgi:hypothetical protein